MLTVNSLSGGKTSSYIAAHYPADIDVFALVCIDDHNANAGKIDKITRQRVNDRLQKYCSDQPEFLATAEDPITIRTIFELEQHIGREITWVRGPGFHDAIQIKQSLPNRNKRWCTTILKIEPIFRFLFKYQTLPVKMRIGYRADEPHRANSFRESFIYSDRCEYRPKSNTWIHRWTEAPFREAEFPLIEDDIYHTDVVDYWRHHTNVPFPKDSNCQFCFWKKPQQLRRNFEENSSIMFSAMIMEDLNGNRFHDGISINGVRHSGIQQELFQIVGGGCHGGYCTN
jgi:hypothetical protein